MTIYLVKSSFCEEKADCCGEAYAYIYVAQNARQALGIAKEKRYDGYSRGVVEKIGKADKKYTEPELILTYFKD